MWEICVIKVLCCSRTMNSSPAPQRLGESAELLRFPKGVLICAPQFETNPKSQAVYIFILSARDRQTSDLRLEYGIVYLTSNDGSDALTSI